LEKHKDKGKAVITLEGAVAEKNMSPSLRVHGASSKQAMSAGFSARGVSALIKRLNLFNIPFGSLAHSD
jgi:hypothetical protein